MTSDILLQPSPYGYISPSVEMGVDSNQNCLQRHFIHHLNPPICAQNSFSSVSSRVTCISSNSTMVTTRAYSEITDHSVTTTSFSQNEDSAQVISRMDRNATATSVNSKTTDGNPWVYETTSRNATTTSMNSNIITTKGNPWVHGTTVRDTETIAKENVWVYGTIAGAVVSTTLVMIVLVIGVSIVCYRCRTNQQGKFFL